MKKLLLMSLTLTMLLSTSIVSFANEGNSKKEIIEAKTVYVGGESRPLSIKSAQAPKGALPARPQDKSGFKKEEIVHESKALQAVSWNYLSGYTVYNQLTSYNCGPATVQAALKHLGYTPSQSDIARGCKTTTNGSYIADMVSYINRQQSKYRYTGRYNESSSEMSRLLYSGVTNSNVAPIVGMTFSTSDGWLYSTNGHFMSVYGAKSDKSSFALADPWIGYSGSGLNGQSSTYTKSTSTIYKAYNKVNIGLMY
jgi:predicted double-glycine peptidase